MTREEPVLTNLYRTAIEELATVANAIDDVAVDEACRRVASARHVCVYAGGREGLQVKGFAMRLFHLGRAVSVVGDMTVPALGPGDLFFVVCGPGEISTAVALVGVARTAGAQVVVVTAQPEGRVPRMADFVLTVPAQTMADDQGDAATSVLPMGSLFEGALFVLFEVMVLKLKTLLDVSPEAMRANHTNME
ncbi:SIS domain-containing protein [Aureimonas flava]|uniref:SIS domain-containing protein n=1 Tax=Aureimonas flava TaxID=2320271 RepID=A0A3A1WQG6_9HYPH|nr:SIS domain-containing protein [Aureimonas flava]RIY03323.1 SIS domain-containing protein [Aureimonas flava]